MKHLGQSLNKIVERADHLKGVRKKDLQFGDTVLIRTQNSNYRILVLDSGFYQVSGGWFDKEGLSPYKLRIAGCTWGSSIIKIDLVAACGLCLEFSNRLITSPIKQFSIIPLSSRN